MSKTFVVGDVHGEYGLLQTLLVEAGVISLRSPSYAKHASLASWRDSSSLAAFLRYYTAISGNRSARCSQRT